MLVCTSRYRFESVYTDVDASTRITNTSTGVTEDSFAWSVMEVIKHYSTAFAADVRKQEVCIPGRACHLNRKRM